MIGKMKNGISASTCDVPIGCEALLAVIPFPVFIKNSEFKYVWANQALLEFIGVSEKELFGRDDFDLFPEEFAASLRGEDERLMAGDVASVESERFLPSSKGGERWFKATKSVVRDDSGVIVGIAGIAVDITESKIADAELELLEPAIHQTSDAIVITDLDGVIKYVNPAFEAVTGYSIDEALGKKPSVLKSGHHPDEYYATLWRTITAGKTWSGHFINKRKDGSEYHEDATISPVRDKNGEITHFVGVKKDITKIVELEERIRQSQKMEAVGRLAGGVAHDFNNILTAILGYSEILLNSMSKDDPARRKVEEIKKAGQRASDITKQMLAFSKRQVMRLAPLDVNEVIGGMRSMLEEIVGGAAKLEMSLSGSLPEVLSDKTHIERVVMNLVVNAVDALEGDGGEIVVATKKRFFKDPFSDGNFSAPPGEYVVVSVSDNGCGMSEEVVKHVFEPFYTNKAGGKGTGLGLSTVYGIVKQHNGFVVVDSTPGKGSVFKVMIPAVADGAVSTLSETEHGGDVFETSDDRSPTLLIVDDETSLLEMMFEGLSDMGYTVLKATSGTEALEQFLMAGQEVDLVVTDIILHGISGIELAEEIRKTAPDTPVLFISGYTGKENQVLSLDSKLNDFLPKPFVMEELEARVKALLRGNSRNSA